MLFLIFYPWGMSYLLLPEEEFNTSPYYMGKIAGAMPLSSTRPYFHTFLLRYRIRAGVGGRIWVKNQCGIEIYPSINILNYFPHQSPEYSLLLFFSPSQDIPFGIMAQAIFYSSSLCSCFVSGDIYNSSFGGLGVLFGWRKEEGYSEGIKYAVEKTAGNLRFGGYIRYLHPSIYAELRGKTRGESPIKLYGRASYFFSSREKTVKKGMVRICMEVRAHPRLRVFEGVRISWEKVFWSEKYRWESGYIGYFTGVRFVSENFALEFGFIPTCCIYFTLRVHKSGVGGLASIYKEPW